MSQSETPALLVRDVTKSYGAVQALNGVSFEVRPGEVFGLLGPNGAGKTSLISVVVTLEKATRGEVRVFGHDVTASGQQAKLNTGFVPQEVINHGFFNVEEVLHFNAGYYGVKDPRKRIEYLLKGLSLSEHRHKKIKQLSGGMKRRLMIAKALVHAPGLLLLDEPTAGVDVELRLKLWDFVEELKNGLSILLTTHYLEEAERLCDRVAIIHKGLIRAEGLTRDLIEKWSRKKVILQFSQVRPAPSHPDLISADAQKREWVFLTAVKKPHGQLLEELRLSGGELADLKVQDGSVEDVFMRLTQTDSTGAL